MKIKFQYSEEKDIWCLLNKGKSSHNSPSATKMYELLVAVHATEPGQKDASDFISKYISEKGISIEHYIAKYQEDWSTVADEYQKRAELIFNTILPNDINAYLTINNRCPYSIEDNYFYVRFPSNSMRLTVMHELWHFYTWYGLGVDQEEKIGKEKYNDLKESLTVLLNIECADLLPEGVQDIGYPQHKNLREKIVEIWNKEKDIRKLWKMLK